MTGSSAIYVQNTQIEMKDDRRIKKIELYY